jgi:hypothetical protein
METLFQYAYTDCIRPEISLTRVNEIVQVSRRNNRLAGITGILVFDGWRFFQYLEAPKTRFAALWTSSGDPRHNNYVELLSSPFAGPRRSTNGPWDIRSAPTRISSRLSPTSMRQS